MLTAIINSSCKTSEENFNHVWLFKPYVLVTSKKTLLHCSSVVTYEAYSRLNLKK